MKINLLVRRYKGLSIIAKATFWFMVCGVLQKSVSLLTTPIFARMLTTEQYGQFTIYNSWLNLFSIITTFRLDYAVFNKGMSKFPEDRDRYTSSMQGATSLITIGVFIIYLLFHVQINALTELSTFITCFMFLELFFMPAIRFWTLKQRYEYKYKSVVFVTVLLAVSNALLGVIAVLLTEEKGLARIFSCIIVQVCFGVVLYTINLKKGKTFFDIKYIRFAVLFNIPLILYYFSGYILQQIDRIMIQKMVNYSAAAIYGVAYNVGMILTFVITSINSAFAPWEYEMLGKKKFHQIEEKFHPMTVGVILLMICFIAFAPEAVFILAGEKYSGAVYIIPAVASSIVFQMLSAVYTNIEFYYDKNKYATVIAGVEAVINLILNYLGILMFGYVAAGYTTLFCFMLDTVLHHLYVNRFMKKSEGCIVFHNKKIVFYCLSMVGATVFMTLLYKATFIRYVFIGIFAIVAYIKRNLIMKLFEMKKS